MGAYDLIESDEDGNRSIIELKTAARKWSDGQVDTELDPAVYSYAFHEMGYSTNGSETLIRFDVLVHGWACNGCPFERQCSEDL